MFKVDIEKQCGCVKRSGLEFPKTFETKEEAEFEALKLANHMNANFCKKHRFFVNEEGDTFKIYVELSCPSVS
ncbi:MAG: hypothetical protein ABGX26_03650 [Nautiliaceae bacterium]